MRKVTCPLYFTIESSLWTRKTLLFTTYIVAWKREKREELGVKKRNGGSGYGTHI